MTIRITVEHNEYRLQGTLDYINLGASRAKLEIYGGTKPATVTTAPGSAMLVAIELTDPAGTISAGQLTLTQFEDGLVQVSGVATWARLINGSGNIVQDMDASDTAGSGEVKLVSTQLYAGGDAKLISATLG